MIFNTYLIDIFHNQNLYKKNIKNIFICQKLFGLNLFIIDLELKHLKYKI